MLDLNDFFYFVQVVDRGGFTAAGRTLRMPKSTLSHRILQLEAELGVRLLNRTSRRFAMTDAGGEFYRHAVAMLQQAETAMRVGRGVDVYTGPCLASMPRGALDEGELIVKLATDCKLLCCPGLLMPLQSANDSFFKSCDGHFRSPGSELIGSYACATTT